MSMIHSQFHVTPADYFTNVIRPTRPNFARFAKIPKHPTEEEFQAYAQAVVYYEQDMALWTMENQKYREAIKASNEAFLLGLKEEYKPDFMDDSQWDALVSYAKEDGGTFEEIETAVNDFTDLMYAVNLAKPIHQ